MADDVIKEFADQILADLKVIIDEFKALHGFDIEKFFNITNAVIKKVEQYSAQVGGLTSQGKEDLAYDVIRTAIKDIPLVPGIFEPLVIRTLIKLIVFILNKVLGKNWLEKI